MSGIFAPPKFLRKNRDSPEMSIDFLKILDLPGEIVLRRKSKSPVCSKISVQGAHRARNRVGEVVPGLAASSQTSGSCLRGTFAALKILQKNHDSPENHYFSGEIKIPENLWEKLFRLESAATEPMVAASGADAAPRAVSATQRRAFPDFRSQNISPENLRRLWSGVSFSGEFRNL